MAKIKYPADYNPILGYWEKIENGEIVVPDKIRRWYKYLVWHIENPDEYFYSSKRANHVLEFAENYCKLSKHKKGTTNAVRLELWEKAHLAAVFGFIDIEGNRQCRESLFIVGKKNGKSLLASIVGDYMLVGDGEPGPEVYAVATKREQANIVWNEAKRMVNKSPTLRRRIKPLVNVLSSEAFNEGSFKPLASDKDSLDGLNVHCCLMDEIHQWKNGKALYDIMADGVTARDQPLIYITSTAGTVREDIYDQKYEEAERVINGLFDDNGYKDKHFFPFIYELDSRKEWMDPKCWIKANPGLGTIKNFATLKAKVEKAMQNSALVKNLVCKEFNIRETSSEAWLTFEDLNNTDKYDIGTIKPRYALGGVDLSSTTDLTCASVIFMIPGDIHVYVKEMFWLPEDLLEQRVREDKIPYDIWKEQELLRTCNGNKVHYKDVVDWYIEVQKEYDLYFLRIGYDSWSADYFVEDMKKNFGAEVMQPVIQGKKTLSSPLKTLGADLKAKIVNYDNNPVTKWCIANTSIDVDKNDNIQPCKGNQGTKRIDGLAGLLDAYVMLEKFYDEYISVI